MKLDLRKDQQKVRKCIEKRIHDYPIYENLGPGKDEDPIRLITLGFYAEQGGYVNLAFDTRPKADVDGELTCLSVLLLNDTQVTDGVLIRVKELSGLKRINLSNTQVTDAGLVNLSGFPNVEFHGCLLGRMKQPRSPANALAV